ncbi:MAG TPA: ABC transporter substrate-binding protein [Stellaceae bacterium]|nr:ABC transporter substrate-binding protein [Stellaceae bacterium]
MRRRELILGIGGTIVAPLAVRAQPPALSVIGFLHSGAPEQNVERLSAYFKGLSETGFVEGQNVAIEYRWAAGHNDKLPMLAAELVQRQVAVIATPASTPAALAAKAATATIPIVFASGADPVALGLVAGFSRPGGNVTGVTSLNIELAAKRLELFRELLPQATRFFTLINPTSALAEPFAKDLETGAATVGIHVEILHASTDREIEAAFAGLPQQPGIALVFGPDSFFYIRRAQIAALAARYAVPAIFDVPEYVEAGALISYGSDFSDVLQLAGRYTGRILKGEKPADLPVAQSTKFKLAINQNTAKALGLTVPPILLAQADEVIE